MSDSSLDGAGPLEVALETVGFDDEDWKAVHSSIHNGSFVWKVGRKRRRREPEEKERKGSGREELTESSSCANVDSVGTDERSSAERERSGGLKESVS